MTLKNLQNLRKKLQQDGITVSASSEFTVDKLKASESYRAILSGLEVSEYSKPQEQKSRNGQMVYRIFYLKGLNKQAPPSFDEMNGKNYKTNFFKKQSIKKEQVT